MFIISFQVSIIQFIKKSDVASRCVHNIAKTHFEYDENRKIFSNFFQTSFLIIAAKA